ncbi:hypothetical protein [Enterobacter soli]|uniref:hypothetical protein n=1 Tax=Enterobacter soli TaxID=885040 RepID=UPI003ED89E1D
MLSTYGLTVSGRYESDLTQMSCAFDGALDSALWLLKLLTDDLRLRHELKKLPLRYNSLNWSGIKLGPGKPKQLKGLKSSIRN